MTASQPIFSSTDQQRFADIKAELRRRLPDTLPRSEEVHRCAILFTEVRDKGYQLMDGHQECEPWMWQLFQICKRQADKYFAAATLPPEEVKDKRQGIEVMGQIGLEQDPEVRAAMWELAEKHRVSETALRAGRMRIHPYLEKGRRQQGIKVLQRVVLHTARQEAEERARQQRTPRSAGQRGKEAIDNTDRALSRLLSDKAEVSQQEAAAIVESADSLLDKVRQLAERHGIPWKFRTAETPPKEGVQDPIPATEKPAPQEAAVITQTAPAQAPPAPQPVTVSGPVLQVPAEVLSFRGLFRFFHQELVVDQQDVVQQVLGAVVQGSDRTFWIREMHRALRGSVPDGSPMKKQVSKLAAGLRAEGMEGRKFALYCLLAARLPGVEQKLVRLSQAEDMPEGLGELVCYYRDLLLGVS